MGEKAWYGGDRCRKLSGCVNLRSAVWGAFVANPLLAVFRKSRLIGIRMYLRVIIIPQMLLNPGNMFLLNMEKLGPLLKACVSMAIL